MKARGRRWDTQRESMRRGEEGLGSFSLNLTPLQIIMTVDLFIYLFFFYRLRVKKRLL